MFKCPFCLEHTQHNMIKFIQFDGAEYTVCPLCYFVIKTLRNKKPTFDVEIQTFEM